MGKKILIIKLGFSETLDPEIGKVPSIGDVLRTTPILYALKEKFPDSHISWLVSEQAEPLLNGNKLIDRVLVWDEFIPFQLMREKYDVLINLEKIPGLSALADMIDAWTKYGFRFEGINGGYHAYERGLNFIDYIEEKKRTKKAKDFWQKVLIEMIGVTWKEQPYILAYEPKMTERFDIGFNFDVGSKWPTKAMSMEKWKMLAKELSGYGYSISWQQGLKDLCEYMDWINSCRLLISNDSLGVHIALALQKKVMVLFGPTDPNEVYLYGNGEIINSKKECEHMPCYSSECLIDKKCMDSISLEEIVEKARNVLEKEVEEIEFASTF